MHHGEGRHLTAQCLLIEQCPIALDVACLFQAADTAQAGRRRYTHPAGEFHVGDSAVILQLAQDVAVDGVQASHSFVYNGTGICETLLRGWAKRHWGKTGKSAIVPSISIIVP
jgi:hypothetical protein